jgi:hypothetical protein
MAYRYINVRLVDFDDPTYREFIAPFLLARETQKGGPVRARVLFGRQVEDTLRHWLAMRTTLLPQRVLGFTEVGGGSARPAYRELDALEPVGERDLIVYEFKASRSPMSLYRGLAQLKKSRRILSAIFRRITGVLFFVYTDPESLAELQQAVAEAPDTSLLAEWTERQALETPFGVILWPVERIVEIAGEENLTLEWEDEEGEEVLIERDQEPWREDWRTYLEDEEVEEPLSALGAALAAARGETDTDKEEP